MLKQDQHVLIFFVDLEDAFDLVWQLAVVYLLHEVGLRGNLFLSSG